MFATTAGRLALLCHVFALGSACRAQPAAAPDAPAAAASQPAAADVALPAIKVTAPTDGPGFDRTQSTSTVKAEDMARQQAGSVFELLRGVPGVAFDGGPRSSGMSFNIRGYNNNEDVAVKLDGVPKGFEKYRFGGIFLEPELLKTLEVQRGPQIASGSGALGGTVSATTRSADDFLAPGEAAGARFKIGHASNNDEWLRALTAYARPAPGLGLLAHHQQRRGDDITLSDGSALSYSATDAQASLLKATFAASDAWRLEVSYADLQDKGLQPYDATGGEPGFFGFVQRAIHDRNAAVQLSYDPGDPWWNLHAVFGRSQTRLLDTHQPGQSLFANAGTGVVTDDYAYTNRTIDITNRMLFAALDLEVLVGLQALESVRETARFKANVPGSGFEPSIPPGIKRNSAVYLQPRWQLGPLEVVPGLRFDHYEVEATGGTEQVLLAAGERSRIRFDKFTPSLGLSLDLLPRRLAVFYNIADAFRPPLVDEYFTQGAFSRCIPALLGTLAPASGICGSLYRPQEATNQELGLTLTTPLPRADTLLQAKLTRYRIDTRHLLRSLEAVSATELGQPGWEHRRGTELEVRLSALRAWSSLAWSALRGTVQEGGSAGADPLPLYNAPADALKLSVGITPASGIEFGVNYQNTRARRVQRANYPGLGLTDQQPGYETFGLFARWAPNRHVELRVSGENMGNKRYYLSNGFGGAVGAEAPGRNVRVSIATAL